MRDRYDFDLSETINHPQELKDLAVNAATWCPDASQREGLNARCRFRMVLDVDLIDEECNKVGITCGSPHGAEGIGAGAKGSWLEC